MNSLDREIEEKAARVIGEYAARGWTIATAESCTGGLIAGTLTNIAGSSAVLDRGYVTYSNRAKQEMIGVERETLEQFGAVSREVAIQMAEGARKNAGVDVTVAVTGVAGPGGGSPEKPVGLVHFASVGPNGTNALERRFGDVGRQTIRQLTVDVAIAMLLQAADKEAPA